MVGYIGKEPTVGNFIKLDAISTSSTNTYNLANGGVAYSPENSRVCQVSLNGVIQSPDTAYTISGSQITFIPSSGTLTSNDTIDFIMVYGDVLSIGTPSDNTVSATKLTTDSVIEAKIQDNAVTTNKIVNDAITEAKLNLISTSSVPSLEAKGDGSSQDGYIKLNCSQNSHGIKLKSPPHSANASYTLTFPNNDGNADEFLKTDGSGVMSWGTAGGTHTKIATADYSSAVSDFTITDCFTSTYPIYKVYLYNLLSASDGVELRAYFLNSGGSAVGTFQQASDGSYIGYSGNSAGVTSQAQDASDYIRFSGEEIQSEAHKVSQLELTIYQPYESTHTTVHYNYLLNSDNDHHYQLDGVGYLSSTTSLRSLKFQSSNGGNFSAYKTVIYGIKR